MSELIFDEIERTAAYLKLNINAQEIADVMVKNKYSDEHAEAISGFLLYLKERRHENLVNMLQQMSRIPFKNPKNFANYDFSRINGKNVDELKNLASLSSLYAHKNLAFIGPQGVGKTHLATVIGIEAASQRISTYFINFAKLMEKFKQAPKGE